MKRVIKLINKRIDHLNESLGTTDKIHIQDRFYFAMAELKSITTSIHELIKEDSKSKSTYRYPWQDAPEWATCAVTLPNSIGTSLWLEQKPGLYKSFDTKICWDLKDMKYEVIKNIQNESINWEDSLEYKPESL